MADILVYLGVAGVIKQLIYLKWSDRRPRDAVLVGHVTKLSLFPVKSMREVDVQKIECSSDSGPRDGEILDRQWMVVSSDRQMVSIRLEPRLLNIQPHFDGMTLTLTSPGYDDVTVDVKEVLKRGEVVKAIKHGISVSGLDCGEAVGKWLDNFLGREGRKLMYAGGSVPRRSYRDDLKMYLYLLENNKVETNTAHFNRWRDADSKHKTLFQDVAPIHLLSEQSVDDLNSRLEDPVDVLQFRPNIVTSANAGAYDEDKWIEICIGDVRFRTTRLMDRCVLPTIDRKTCIRNPKNEPLKTLKSYRTLVPGLGPMLGTDLVVERPGTIHVGDPIYAVQGDMING